MDQALKRIIRFSVIDATIAATGRYYVPAAVSNRHIHLSRHDLETLFGEGAALHPQRDLAQHGQYSCTETVDFCGPKGTLHKIRVLGPLREETQLELSITDCFKTGVPPAVRMSGDIRETTGGRLVGPEGETEIAKGVIVAARHLHASPQQAEKLGLRDKDVVCLRKAGIRAITLENVEVRVRPDFELELHIDTDEANACMIANGDLVEIRR